METITIIKIIAALIVLFVCYKIINFLLVVVKTLITAIVNFFIGTLEVVGWTLRKGYNCWFKENQPQIELPKINKTI